MNLWTVLIILLAFWGILYVLFGRKKEEEEEGLVVDLFIIMWRTKKLLGFIDKFAQKYTRFWKVYGTIGIIVGFGGMVFVFYMLIRSALIAIRAKAQVAGVQLVIPGVTIPLWYGLIGLIVVMVVHELSHGVVARAEGLPLKSVGLILFFVIPGAFVEPDEDELRKAPLIKRLRVYAAGSMANIVTALLAAVLILSVFAPLIQYAGVEIVSFDPNGPAIHYLKEGDIIVGIDGVQIKTIEDFLNFMNKTKAGQVVTLEVIRNGEKLSVKVPLGEHPNNPGKGYLGVYPSQYVASTIGHENVVLPIYFALNWIYILNLGIGLMNLFPLIPLDGGRMLDETLKEFLPEKIAKPISFAFIGIGVLLLAINLIPAIRNLIG
ncbi:PDZ domain-containing protein [Thermococcus sp. M39]|uniref:site-2 protease family protein n=1 Tax=unclassified Thermococcus TaxID=2627626 RepID=UPI00143A999E|nr:MULTISPECIES: site-2 protease family protein [unclassified Thermococcus]NJE08440.1 PDZ domain-containing protein [Thermococcus sp. M39]NJE11943.1 PDZ domain-containing protein [Thermococcus sp. LS2]